MSIRIDQVDLTNAVGSVNITAPSGSINLQSTLNDITFNAADSTAEINFTLNATQKIVITDNQMTFRPATNIGLLLEDSKITLRAANQDSMTLESNSVMIKGNGLNTIEFTDTYINIQSGKILRALGNAVINLPNGTGSTQIEGQPVGPEFTATNINNLLSGGNADALHTHLSDGYIVESNLVAGENITDGYLVAIDNSSGPKVFHADANGAGELVNPVGLASGDASLGEAIDVITFGGKDTGDDVWDVIPEEADIGKIAYMSETPGHLTLTPPTTPGSIVQKVGIVSDGGSGMVRVLIQIGDGVLL